MSLAVRTAIRSTRRVSTFTSVPRTFIAIPHVRNSTSTSSGPAMPSALDQSPLPTSGTVSKPPADKMVHIQNISAATSEVDKFRRVVWTGKSSQLVVMNVPAGGDIGEEVHHVDQHLFFTSGKARAVVGGEEKEVEAGDLVIVPQGVKHNFINIGPTPVTLYTVYAPAEHDPRSVHTTKDEGEKLEDEGKDEAPKWSQSG